VTDISVPSYLIDTEFDSGSGTELSPVPLNAQPPADRHPACVYLASLAPGSRPAMRGSLQVVAELLTGGCSTPL
jgi:hypothetical protein